MGDSTKRLTCATANCGTFVMDESLYNKLQRTGETFHCPDGHPQHFTESTESKLRDRIEALEQEVHKQRGRVEDMRDRFISRGEKAREEKRKRKQIQRALLPAINGVVQVGEDQWLWGCACGGAAQKIFGTKDRARRGLEQHREKSCDGGVADRIESIQQVGRLAADRP